jgi:hypothetical protein
VVESARINLLTHLNLKTSVGSPKSAQPLGQSSKSLKFRTTNKVALHFKLSLSEPMAYTAFGRSTEVSRLKNLIGFTHC